MDSNQYLTELMKRSLPKELAFAESEYRLRVDKVRKLMDEKGVDVLLVQHPTRCVRGSPVGISHTSFKRTPIQAGQTLRELPRDILRCRTESIQNCGGTTLSSAGIRRCWAVG